MKYFDAETKNTFVFIANTSVGPSGQTQTFRNRIPL